MRVKTTLIFAAASLAAGPAAAAQCLPGQFYRVKLDECVDLGSPLARPFLGEATRKTTPIAKPVRMAKRADPGFVDPPPEGPDPALPQADHTGDPPDENDRIGFPLPSVSATLWVHPTDPPDLMMIRQPEGPDPGAWPSLSRQWPT